MSYIGRSAKLSRKTQEKVSFLATAGQTVATGLAYVPTFIEVILNGSTLTDVTDYTATDGNSITFLGDPLTLNDEVTIISLKTFALADHYNKSEADALLAAKAALASPVFTGPATVNRLSTDGTIVDLQKDGTTVGSIGVASDLLGIGNGTGNLGFFDAKVVPMGNTTGYASNNVIDLGSGGRAFKDLYLSGGVHLGGTGPANKLDDYESGSWTPTLTSGTLSPYDCRYYKIGSWVYLWGYLSAFSDLTSSTVIDVGGLPFNANSNTSAGVGPVMLRYVNVGSTAYSANIYLRASTQTLRLYWANDNASYSTLYHSGLLAASASIRFQLAYRAA